MPVGVRVGGTAAGAALLAVGTRDGEAMLAWTGAAALVFLALAGAASIAGPARRHARTLGLAALACSVVHLAVFCAKTGSPKPVAWFTAALEKPFVVPGLAALLVLWALSGRAISRALSQARISARALGDAALFLAALHLVGVPDPNVLTIVPAVGCLALVALRNGRPILAARPPAGKRLPLGWSSGD